MKSFDANHEATFVSGLTLVARVVRNIEQKKKEQTGCNRSFERGIKNDTKTDKIFDVST